MRRVLDWMRQSLEPTYAAQVGQMVFGILFGAGLATLMLLMGSMGYTLLYTACGLYGLSMVCAIGLIETLLGGTRTVVANVASGLLVACMFLISAIVTFKRSESMPQSNVLMSMLFSAIGVAVGLTYVVWTLKSRKRKE